MLLPCTCRAIGWKQYTISKDFARAALPPCSAAGSVHPAFTRMASLPRHRPNSAAKSGTCTKSVRRLALYAHDAGGWVQHAYCLPAVLRAP